MHGGSTSSTAAGAQPRSRRRIQSPTSAASCWQWNCSDASGHAPCSSPALTEPPSLETPPTSHIRTPAPSTASTPNFYVAGSPASCRSTASTARPRRAPSTRWCRPEPRKTQRSSAGSHASCAQARSRRASTTASSAKDSEARQTSKVGRPEPCDGSSSTSNWRSRYARARVGAVRSRVQCSRRL